MTHTIEVDYALGRLFALGEGVPADAAAAERHYSAAATRGYAPAQAELGLLLFADGRRTDALTWLKKAAEQKDARAFYMLGVASFNGDLIPRDLERARLLLSAAADDGIAQAKDALQKVASYEVPEDEYLISDAASAAMRRHLAMVAAASVSDGIDPLRALVEPMVRDILSETLERLLMTAIIEQAADRLQR